jgi:CheY-like chemotaxis protein
MGKTVLIVEDDLNIRELFTELFESEGYQVVTAVNGLEGLDKIRSKPTPNVVVLDMIMPIMNGQGFLSHVMADPKISNIPVVLVSATAGEYDTVGAVAFMKKPVDLDGLLNLVAKYAN